MPYENILEEKKKGFHNLKEADILQAASVSQLFLIFSQTEEDEEEKSDLSETSDTDAEVNYSLSTDVHFTSTRMARYSIVGV